MSIRSTYAKVSQGNDWLAEKTTDFIGSMWCAYVFAAYSVWQAPATIKTLGFGNWFTEEFLQLVLLSVIMVGQNVQTRKHDAKVALDEKRHAELLARHDDLLRKQASE
jgi:hypothetical protein